MEGGKTGKLVVLESRTELDCLIEYMNDQFDDPTVLHKYTLGLKGQTTQNKGIFKWQGVDASLPNFDAATPSWTNWSDLLIFYCWNLAPGKLGVHRQLVAPAPSWRSAKPVQSTGSGL